MDELTIMLFRKHIFSDPVLNQKFIQGICDMISLDREREMGCQFDHVLFKEAVAMFHALAVYTKHFEPKMLAESQGYFKWWSDDKVTNLDLPKYVQASHALLQSEFKRCEEFGLEASTRRSLQKQIETFLIDDRTGYLTDKDQVAYLMSENAFDALKSLFDLLQMKGHGHELRPAFEQFINNEGEGIVFDEKHEADMVVRLLQFKRKLNHIWEYSFAKNEELGVGLREAFRTFINKTKKTDMTWGTDNDKPGEMIAKHVDMLLRGGFKVIPKITAPGISLPTVDEEEADENEEEAGDEKMNEQLNQVLELFRFVHGKAVFEAFYKKDLAKRLLMKRSASDQAEKSMLERLNSECGANFTSNLEAMFRDMELSRDENAAYKSRLEDRGERSGMDLEVNVLESSAWPTYPDVEFEIPREIQRSTQQFEQHYKSHHSGRKLGWKHAMAHCQLTARFPQGRKELVVSSFQAIVLLHFNDRPSATPVTYSELKDATRLGDVDLKRTLQSLACAQYRVLTKSPRGKDVNGSDTFAVNVNFAAAKVRIKINSIQLKETREENKQTHERVAADRQYETQAAIVRIMKAKQKIKHVNLVAEVIDVTKKRGTVSPEDIKRQIDK